jgi:phosphatidylglycerol:prolipoprotein diacylglycerol transferase
MHPWLTPPDSLVPLPSYFTLLIGGFMLAIYLAQRLAPRHGIASDDLIDLGLYMLLAGLVGARILHVLASNP